MRLDGDITSSQSISTYLRSRIFSGIVSKGTEASGILLPLNRVLTLHDMQV